ncbi:phenylalanine--tRNA ligase subunit alpha [Candidatus Bathyarchaeota archaeon A05DMB-2]|jgi:phenylalanyl-tRNA synthetase alpha chain|nr:phenylalanine--tRNA ligase subunit alpha [Candidatus Bathyarchaeota archaeon A05DMB-2]
MVELRAHEQKILSALEKFGGTATVEELIAECGFPDAAVMRAALTLKEKDLVKIYAEQQTQLRLTSEGEHHAKNGLPERRLIKAIAALGGAANLNQAAEKAGLEPQFKQIALGWAIRKKWAIYDSATNTVRIADPRLHQVVIPEENDEALLTFLSARQQTTLGDLTPELQSAVETLKKRKLLTVEPKTKRKLEITHAGLHAATRRATAAEITQLTPELIITGKWRNGKLQKYNIQAPVAKTWPGKKHPYLSFLEEVRMKLVQLGFKEMTGTNVETAFFNFDALYTPQDHPAREPSDIYYVKSPVYGDISKYKTAVEHVKETHENGWKTGSTGWHSTYSIREAERLILRGHGTCLSARTLLSKDLELPSRYFSIARVYRPEVIDKTHLSEFNQVEGIVVDEHLTLRDLLGVLEKFAREIAGADKVRFKPDYFPFTEPSVELSAYKEGYGWVEFGGSGIFRPEVTLPLGVQVPVIAWGLGVDRLFMMRAGIDDIRCIFSQDLDWLRRKQVA